MTKADYVRSQPQTRKHKRHWPDCGKQVPPAMWGCSQHWFRLPETLRRSIWQTYHPGQEKDMKPSREYLAVARESAEMDKRPAPCPPVNRHGPVYGRLARSVARIPVAR